MLLFKNVCDAILVLCSLSAEWWISDMRIDAPTFVPKSDQFLLFQVNFLPNFTSWLFQKMLFETRSPFLSLFFGFFGCFIFTVSFKYYSNGRFKQGKKAP